jgi:beta-phosphoglucomutase-like phosphatase (HAD superfamily)
LAEFFEHIVGGDQVVKGKPEPEIYFKAAAMLDRQANECIVFEDSDPGVLAAIRSGAQTVQIPDLKAPSPETTKLGHIIAPTLLDGAKAVGLI